MTWSYKHLALLIFLCLALFPRILDLGAFLSPDEPRWLQNTLGFKQGLLEGNFKQLYQQPHPGITTMWLAASTIDSDSWAVRRLPQAIALSVLILGATLIAIRLWGFATGYVVGLLLALNPHFIAHSRVLAMDALLALFLFLSVICLIAWSHERDYKRWIYLAGSAAALAVLSKLSGLVLLVFAVPFVIAHGFWGTSSWKEVVKDGLRFSVAFVVTMIIVFPTLLTNPLFVFQQSRDFFGTEFYTNSIHALGAWWYPQAVALWSTPLHLLGILALPFLFFTGSRRNRWDTLAFIVFGTLFFLAMEYSIKKGDRYLLPFFLILDAVAALSLVHFFSRMRRWSHPLASIMQGIASVLIGGACLWQIYAVATLHPHYLAYRNPFFRSLAVGRTMGWGEGLDLAAEYLNAKPQSDTMLVIAYYEGPFAYRFQGKVTSAERLAQESAQEIGGDYVVLYRTMEGRAPDRWETKVLQQFADQKPEKVIILNGEQYAWIYSVKSLTP